jgi:ABC-2 type transport system permease protein
VISTLYILAVVLLTALPCHFYLAASRTHPVHLLAEGVPAYRWLEFWLIAGTVGSVLLGVLATVVPLRIGFRAFRRLEF